MTTLLHHSIARTLTQWLEQRLQTPRDATQWQLWCFEGPAARRAAEQALAAHGISARIRSSYKPVVHAVLEEVALDGLQKLIVHYPVHPQASPQRFLLESYPLAAMLPGVDVQLLPGSSTSHYHIDLHYAGQRMEQLRVFAPNRPFTSSHGSDGITPCGWQSATPANGLPTLDEALTTDYEQAYADAMATIRQHPWPQAEPYFGRLRIHMALPGYEHAIPHTHETISTPEAMHEELYFSLLEFFQHHSDRAAGDRRLQPGQIVPDIRTHSGGDPLAHHATTVLVEMLDLPAADDAATQHPPAASIHAAALAASQLRRAPAGNAVYALAQPLFDAHGAVWPSHSAQGRTVHAVYQRGSDHAVVLTGGQHANEISGVAGALRGALALAQQANSHFAYVPIENPDGYALHQWYCETAPQQMHHAARYTALGDDLEYRDHAPWLEAAVRRDAIAGSGAQLHLSLHGYPAHEWTRPLTGYIPQGFDLWTIPKGFFLIIRYHDGWEAEANQLAQQVTQALLQVPGLPAFNAQQLALYQQHSGQQPFALIHGTPCSISRNNASPAPMTFITEFPDQTVEGDAFVFAHTVQQAAVVAAYAAWQDIMQNR